MRSLTYLYYQIHFEALIFCSLHIDPRVDLGTAVDCRWIFHRSVGSTARQRLSTILSAFINDRQPQQLTSTAHPNEPCALTVSNNQASPRLYIFITVPANPQCIHTDIDYFGW